MPHMSPDDAAFLLNMVEVHDMLTMRINEYLNDQMAENPAAIEIATETLEAVTEGSAKIKALLEESGGTNPTDRRAADVEEEAMVESY